MLKPKSSASYFIILFYSDPILPNHYILSGLQTDYMQAWLFLTNATTLLQAPSFLTGYCSILLDVLFSFMPSLWSALHREARESFHDESEITSVLCSNPLNDYPSSGITAKIFTRPLQPCVTCHSLVPAFSSPFLTCSSHLTNTSGKNLPQHLQELFSSSCPAYPTLHCHLTRNTHACLFIVYGFSVKYKH